MKTRSANKRFDAIGKPDAAPGNPWLSSTGFWLMIAIALFYLLTEHRAHFIAGLTWLPFLLLLACLLMHVFGHSGHGWRAAHRDANEPPSNDTGTITRDTEGRGDSKSHETRRHDGDLP